MNKMTRVMQGCLLLFAIAILVAPYASKAQINAEVYGQNRVQYRKFDWKFFDTRHFRVYHYDRSGVSLARYVCEQAERDIRPIERRMGTTFPKRFNIILYNGYDEFRQTNVGLKYESQTQDIPAGMVNVQGDRLLVYFNGIHTDLRRQIRLGMTRVAMERMLLGDNFREVVKNSLLLNTPQWVVEGYVAYVVDGWDPKTESEWKNALYAHPEWNFFELSDQYPELSGKAFYKYTADRYGEQMIRSLLFSMQSKSSLNQGIKSTFGAKVNVVYDSLLAYYRAAYTADSQRQETPVIDSALIAIKIPKDGSQIKSMRVSPRGHDVAYCVFKQGEYRIYIQHTSGEQQRSQILYEGRKDYNELTPDPDYPILAWSNNGYKLAILYRRKQQTRLRIYNSLRARIENYIIPPNRFDRVLGMTFNEDNDKIVFSAVKKSQTDLYEFTIKGSRLTNITNDVWDDVQPQFVSGGSHRGILFMSNRPVANMDVPAEVNELPTGPMNVYFYDTKTLSRELLQCSYNKGGNLTQPIQYGPDNFAYLLDTNGIQNKYVVTFVRKAGNLDSAVSTPVTNYSRSIISHQYNSAARQAADILQVGEYYNVYFGPLIIPGKNTEGKTLVPTTLSRSSSHASSLSSSTSENSFVTRDEPEEPVVRRGNAFQTEFSDTTTNYRRTARAARRAGRMDADTELLLNPLIKDSTYLKLKAQPYRLSFKPDFFTLRLDNTVLFNRYQSVATNGGSYSSPSLAGLFTVSLNDALENHRFTGGIRLPPNFTGITYFLQYQNFTRRWDWGVMYLRTANFYTYDVTYTDSSGVALLHNEQLGKSVTNLIQGSVSYPLDRIRRLGLHLGLRQDVLDFKAEDTLSLSFSPRTKQYWMMSRAEYVFDNSRPLAINLREGFRYKFFGEYLLGLSKENKGGFYNLGLDFRYYGRIYKNTIFAARLAGAHSAGKQHILYFLGGVDNWIKPKYGSTPVDPSQVYGFMGLVTNLRGYALNERNGNTYAVTNLEIRFPVLATLIRKPIQSAFLRNMQLVGFTDAGSAWNGLLPDVGNPDRPGYFTNGTTTVSVNVHNAQGLGLGYGGGIRSTLLGYFMRLDAAWNYEGRRKPIWYFSIGTDF